MINVIAACEMNNGIGHLGIIPWYFKSDMIFFKQMTQNQTVVMGRTTWNSLPIKPLSKRKNIILTTTIRHNIIDNVLVYNNFNDIVENHDDFWVIGGEKLYKLAFNHPNLNTLYLTRIIKEYECNKFLPDIPKYTQKKIINKIYENDVELIFEKYSFQSLI